MKKSITEKITNYLKKNRRRWISGGELEDLNKSFKCKASTISRKIRDLYKVSERIGRTYKNTFVYYRWI